MVSPCFCLDARKKRRKEEKNIYWFDIFSACFHGVFNPKKEKCVGCRKWKLSLSLDNMFFLVSVVHYCKLLQQKRSSDDFRTREGYAITSMTVKRVRVTRSTIRYTRRAIFLLSIS